MTAGTSVDGSEQRDRLRELIDDFFNSRTAEESLDRLERIVKSLPDHVKKEARHKSATKDVQRRFLEHVEVINELLATGKVLVPGDSYEDRYLHFQRLIRHVERTWNAAVTLLRAGNVPASLFFALVTIEEAGKVSIARYHLLMTAAALRKRAARKKSARPFYQHRKKYLLAAGAGALINSRLD